MNAYIVTSKYTSFFSFHCFCNIMFSHTINSCCSSCGCCCWCGGGWCGCGCCHGVAVEQHKSNQQTRTQTTITIIITQLRRQKTAHAKNSVGETKQQTNARIKNGGDGRGHY